MRCSGRATRTLLQEIRERPEIPHIEQRSNVALHVGRYVISQPRVRGTCRSKMRGYAIATAQIVNSIAKKWNKC